VPAEFDKWNTSKNKKKKGAVKPIKAAITYNYSFLLVFNGFHDWQT
jgi:hypothetical protein